MNIYRFTGSRCNTRILKATQHTPSPLMYVAGRSSPGHNRLQLSLAPPASQPASRSVCIFISTRPNYATARCQIQVLTSAHFGLSQSTGCNPVSQRDLRCLFVFSLKTCYFFFILRLKFWIAVVTSKLEMLFGAKTLAGLFFWRTHNPCSMISQCVSDEGIFHNNQSLKSKWKSWQNQIQIFLSKTKVHLTLHEHSHTHQYIKIHTHASQWKYSRHLVLSITLNAIGDILLSSKTVLQK